MMVKHAIRKLAILGCYPPPHGGVTTHVMRLCALLTKHNVDYVVYNANSSAEDGERVFSVARRRHLWMLWYMAFGKEPNVYIVSPRLAAWVAGALMAACRGKKVSVRLQNSQLVDWERGRGLRFALARFALRRMAFVVCVNDDLAQSARRTGVASDRIHVFPGFLCPSEHERNPSAVAPEVWRFAEDHRPLVSINGRVASYQGHDLYGLDQFVELIGRLKKDYQNLGGVICFCDHSPEDEAHVERLKDRARQLGVEKNVLFNTQPGLFIPVIERSDVFVRPTNTDGDAGSIREALAFGVPVVASDCVNRPEGARVFRTRDMDDFEEKTRQALQEATHRGSEEPRDMQGEQPRWSEPYVKLIAALSEGIVQGESRP